MKKRVGTIVVAFVLLGLGAKAKVSVDINLDTRHEVGGVSEFDREKYIVLHAGLRDNDWDSASQRAGFLNDYDVYLGRNNGSLPWQLSQVDEHPTQSGWVDLSDLQTNGDNTKSSYGADTAVHSLEARSGKMMIGGQMSMYPNGQTNGNGFAIGSYDALAEYYENYFSYFHGTGGATGEPKPHMVEVVNEPFVAANRYGTTKENIAELHNVVAQAIRNSHPDILVGGYTAAHPAYESGNFGHWDTNWRMFIDTAGTNMDFFSLHLYDYLNKDVSTDPADTQYRSGSNIEAILDMVEHYSMLALGEVKPFAISEFGAFEPKTGGEPWSAENDWSDIRSYSTILMQLLERPNAILHAIPFMILKAEWGRNSETGNPYGPRLLRQNFENPGDTGNHWVYTERIKWFELWKEVNGIRVDTVSSDPDVQVDAYVDDAHAFVIVSSLVNDEPVTVDLDLFGANQGLADIEVKHATTNGMGHPVLVQYTTNSLPEITLPASSTAVIKYVFNSALVQSKQLVEHKYYATTYLQPIAAGVPIDFSFTNVNFTSTYAEVVLRLGLGRAHGLSLQPVLTVNGTEVPVPDDWRGYDQQTRDSFFGVLEIPVPYELLQSNTTVTVQFADHGGHVSSVAMQVFEFESDIRTRARMIPIDSAVVQGSEFMLEITEGPTNGWMELHSITNLMDGSWTVEQKSLPTDASGQGSVIHLMDQPHEFFRIVEGSAPGIPVSGFTIEPDTGSVSTGGTFRLIYSVLPDDAEDKGIIWSSDAPGIASVSGGVVSGNAAGSATITGQTVDGGFTDHVVMTVGSTVADIVFDDVNNYKNQSFTNGTYLAVKTRYDAGAGHAVLSPSDGISYKLRLIDASGGSWSVVKDYNANDAAAAGTSAGVSEGQIWLPEDILPTAALPTNQFYYLFASFNSTDGGSESVGTQPLEIINPGWVPVIEFTGPDYVDGALDGQPLFAAESGWTVTNTAGSGHAVTADHQSAAVLTNAVQLGVGGTYRLSINMQFSGTYSTPTAWAYIFLAGLKGSSTAESVGVAGPAADVNIQIYSGDDQYRLLNEYSGTGASSIVNTLDAGDVLHFDYELTLGADAATTIYTVRLQNLTDGDDTGIGTVSGVDASVYNALTGTGAYGFFQSHNLTQGDAGFDGLQVNSVTVSVNP